MEVLADRSSLSAGFIIKVNITKTSQFETFLFIIRSKFLIKQCVFCFSHKTAGKGYAILILCHRQFQTDNDEFFAIGSFKQLLMNSLLLAVLNS